MKYKGCSSLLNQMRRFVVVQNNLFQDNVIWNAVKYLRLSDDDKDKDVSNSVINQGKIISSFVENDTSINLIDTFCDDGFTGINFNRPAFKAMMREIEAGQVNCIVVKSLSRFGRSQADVCNYVQKQFPAMGVRFIAIKERIDTYSDKKRLVGFEFPMLAFMNELKPMDTSRKTRISLESKRKAGLFVGSVLPYGYIRSEQNKNVLVIDVSVKRNVELIFNMFINCESLKRIASHLNKENIYSPMAHFVELGLRKLHKSCNPITYKNWKPEHVKKILSCELYTGDMIQGKTTSFSYKANARIDLPREKWHIVKNTHEAIVSHEMFNNVSKILSRKHKPIITVNTTPSIFAGYIYCGNCDKPMTRTVKTIGEVQYIKYLCSTFKKHGKSACTSHYVHESVINDVVLFSLQAQIACIDDINDVLSKVTVRKQTDTTIACLENQQRKYDQEIKQLDKLITDTYLDYKKEIFDDAEYIDIKSSFKSEKESLQAKNEHITKEIAKTRDLKLKYSDYINEFIAYKNIKTLTRSIIVSLIDKIIVSDDNKIKIIFNYQDQLKNIRSIFAK